MIRITYRYLQARRAKSWLCGARGGSNAHRQQITGGGGGERNAGGFQGRAPDADAATVMVAPTWPPQREATLADTPGVLPA